MGTYIIHILIINFTSECIRKSMSLNKHKQLTYHNHHQTTQKQSRGIRYLCTKQTNNYVVTQINLDIS